MNTRLVIYLVVGGLLVAVLLWMGGLFSSTGGTAVAANSVGQPRPAPAPVLPVPESTAPLVTTPIPSAPGPVLVAPPVRPTPQLDDAIRMPAANPPPASAEQR